MIPAKMADLVTGVLMASLKPSWLEQGFCRYLSVSITTNCKFLRRWPNAL